MRALTGLFPHLLGDDWNRLPPAVRRMHGSQSRCKARGRANVEGDSTVLERAMRSLLGMPRPQADIPIEVEILRDGLVETWRRHFPDRMFVTHLAPSWRSAHTFDERVGAMTLTFEPHVTREGLEWITRGVRLLGMPLPLAWFTGVTAKNIEDAHGRYRFDIAVSLPLIGRLIAYSGWLEVGDE